VWQFLRDTDRTRKDRARLAEFAVLFLRWESLFPNEWHSASPWTPWITKRKILRLLTGEHLTSPLKLDLVDLVTAALYREHHCEDRWYAVLSRSLDGPGLRNRLDVAATHHDDLVRLRAGYLDGCWIIPKHP
jgi:hypothetical protein